ncbi:hypothetical protein [Kushneria aurantia]|uniref:Auxin efflux carrier n=1 Tax=Kushneria aurantia TaxID=504092 RepID=A0ABV6G1T5_9GAMM|nr:hypothetical protein [Kushneria aurantia]
MFPAWLLGLRGDLWKAAFLIGVLPSATAVPTLALNSGIYSDEAAATVLVSTLFAIVTISAGIAVAGLM